MRFTLILPTIAISLLLSSICLGQESGARPRPMPARRTARKTGASSAPLLLAVESAGEEIRTARPEISDSILDDDQNTVYEAFAKITTLFKERGFDAKDAEEAVISTWKDLRIGSKPLEITISLRLEILVGKVGDLGKLVIISSPDEAEIELDGHLEGQTEKGLWITPGKYKVRLSKHGYKSVEDVCEVKKGRRTEFKRDLPSLN